MQLYVYISLACLAFTNLMLNIQFVNAKQAKEIYTCTYETLHL
jgi:hypothetical protein